MKNKVNKIIEKDIKMFEKDLKATKGLLYEFKNFIGRGNVLDLAVGVIIGAAFGRIVTSLVNDIIMPVVGVLLGGVDFSSLVIQVGAAQVSYGSFLKNVVDFLIIAASIFVFIKLVKTLERRAKVTEVKDAKVAAVESEQVKLLREIRDTIRVTQK